MLDIIKNDAYLIVLKWLDWLIYKLTHFNTVLRISDNSLVISFSFSSKYSITKTIYDS